MSKKKGAVGVANGASNALSSGLLTGEDEPDTLEVHADESEHREYASQSLLSNARDPNEQTIHFDIHDEEDDDDEDEIVFQPSRLSSYDGSATSPTTQRNPYMNLKDIADQEVGYADETDNLALYQNDIAQRPRVARILGRLVRFGAKGEEEDQFNAEASMLALLRKRQTKFGTLTGVYLPTIQNILGVILFLRLAWIVGIAGVGSTLLIILICCTTTMLTAISMSAIATNGVVPAGGAYFMISRSLGPEFGGAVGILFYLGTTFASAMYILGAVELMLTYIAPGMSAFGEIEPGTPSLLNNMRLYGSTLLLLMGLIVFVGVKYVNRFASLCLLMVIISIFCIYIGFFTSPTSRQPDICTIDGALVTSDYEGTCTPADAPLHPWQTNSSVFSGFVTGFPGLTKHSIFKDNFGTHFLKKGESLPGVVVPTDDVVTADITTSFTLLLAIFFPACTGIMAGSNRSGDLKDASRAIPVGTISAILTTGIIYITFVLFIGGVVEGTLLRDKFGDSINGRLIVAEVAWPHPLIILIGSLMSTVGAGLQSLTGAPRLLQAIAKDNLLPFLAPFSKASSSGEPTRALLLTLLLSECGVLIASLDAVAPIITMFFLMCYGFVNLACSLQSLLKAPSWRPRFKYYHWGLSSLGVVLCLVLMFISSWVYALVAMVLAGIVYYYIEFKGAAKEWGDGIRGLSMQAARFSLLRLEETPPHTKNWRPQLLTLVKLNPDLYVDEPRLIDLAGWLKGGKGLNMVASVLKGDALEHHADRIAGRQSLRLALQNADIQGFAQVVVSQSVGHGLSYLIQNAGLGALTHNSILIGWPEGWRTRIERAQSVTAEDASEDDARAALRQASLFVRALAEASLCQHAIIVPKNIHLFPSKGEVQTGTIDVWWIVHDGGMLILLAFLLQHDPIWRKCKLRVFTVAENDDNSIQMQADLQTFLYHLRITAEVKVVDMLDSDISAYTYERTKVLEKRADVLAALNLSKKQKKRVAEIAIEKSKKDPALGAIRHGAEDGSSAHNLRQMNTSVKLNKIVREHSADSSLILINLPGAPADCADSFDAATKYLEFIEVLTEQLQRVVMVKGGGREVITVFS